jgi:hypothetical protein
MPQVPRPDECKSEIDYIKDMAKRPETTEEGKARLMAYVTVCSIRLPCCLYELLSGYTTPVERREPNLGQACGPTRGRA